MVNTGGDDVKTPLEMQDTDNFEFQADGLSCSPIFWISVAMART